MLRYVDLYMSDVSHLLSYDPSHRFYPHHAMHMVSYDDDDGDDDDDDGDDDDDDDGDLFSSTPVDASQAHDPLTSSIT